MLFTPKTVLSLLILIGSTRAILQTGQLDVKLSNGADYQLLVSQASFGPNPKQGVENNVAHTLALSPKDNPLLCDNTTNASPTSTGLYLLVPRGECTFETKAMNAQRLGAAGIVVEGSLASRYTLNKTEEKSSYTEEDIIYPANLNDYDCQKGRAEIPANSISMTPLPYNSERNDPVLSGDSPSNLCLQESKDQLVNCDSKACLLTGNKTEDGQLEACCAWDFHLWLYNDPTFTADDITIPAVYVTLRQAQQLVHDMKSNTLTVTMSSRDRAEYNISALLIWALGVFVATVAAYLSASDYREMTNRYTEYNNRQSETTSIISKASMGNSESVALSPTPARQTYAAAPAEETLELSAEHALGFIIMASSGLFILFFFKIYSAVKVMYGFGCSRAVMQVIFLPLVRSIFNRARLTNKVIYKTNIEDIGDITTVDLIAGICGYSLGMTWLFVAFTTFHPESNPFFWITQDIMGACMCIMFLSLIKLNSMKVASILLMVAFFYDIFFVFVTPLIFKGESVMITVATSGGPPKADPLWCEKYPHDTNCQGGDPLPMLLTMPRFHDYQGGASLLGLGDIVLPGLLLSFAARLDAAKALLGVVGGGSRSMNSYTCPKQRFCFCCNSGYFAPLVVAYAIGLMMANCAVYLMNMGQPALLYLVPMCLGCMCFMGWKRNELTALWDGPKLIRTADVMLYGEYYEEGHEAVPQHDTDDMDDDVMESGASSSFVPSANNDDDDNRP